VIGTLERQPTNKVNGRSALAKARLVLLSLRRRNAKCLPFAGFTFALALAFSLTTAAQTSSTESKQQASPDPSQTDSAGNVHRDRVDERLKWLSQHLNLTEDQKKQLRSILAGEFKQMRAVGEDASLTQDQKRERMKHIHEASRPQVQAILTPEQQQKFAQMKEEAKERRGEKKDKGQSDHQPQQ